MSEKYFAFISYVRNQNDSHEAAWLQKALENYRIPDGASRDWRTKRLGSAFVDDSELAARPDLPAAIDEALKASANLIVVCSDSTPGSSWVNLEIRRFRQLRPNGKVLPVLVAGTPETAFPHELVQNGIAPLAADLRPSKQRTRQQLERETILKLVAAVLNCGLDDLVQRHKMRERQRALIIGGLISALVLVGLYGLYRFNRVNNERQKAGISENAASAASLASQPGQQLTALRLSLESAGLAKKLGTIPDPVLAALRVTVRAASALELDSGAWNRLIVSEDGEHIAATDGRRLVRWSSRTGTLESSRAECPVGFDCGDISHNGKWLLAEPHDSSDKPSVPLVIDSATGQTVSSIEDKCNASPEFTPDSKRVLARMWTRSKTNPMFVMDCFFDTQSGERLSSTQDDGDWYTTVSDDGTLMLTRKLSVLSDPKHPKLLEDQNYTVWDTAKGTILSHLEGHKGKANGGEFSPNSQRVGTVDEPGAARVFDARTGKLICELEDAVPPIRMVRFSHDSKRILGVQASAEAAVWDAETGKKLFSLHGQTKALREGTFSPDDALIVAGSDDATAHVWRAADGSSDVFLQHSGPPSRVMFVGNSERLLTVDSQDQKIRIWDLPSQRRLSALGSEASTNISDLMSIGCELLSRRLPSQYSLVSSVCDDAKAAVK